ncbi:MAG: DNA/RNA nuclease SfsA [Candidatus Bathyarchaeia archaeon]
MSEAILTLEFDMILGTFIRRLNRFMALVDVEGKAACAHLPNSGRLMTALYPGVATYLRKFIDRPWRKSNYSMFAVQHDNVTVIVDAQFSNFLAKEAIKRNLFIDLAGYRVAGEGFKLSENPSVRLDLMLERETERYYVEVKSVTHVVDGIALFPDAPTIRGRRHVLHLSSLANRGLKTGLIFSVQRPDALIVKANKEIDPQFADILRVAVARGVKIFTLKSTFKPPRTIRLEPNKPPFAF